MIKKAYVDTADGQIHYRFTSEGSGEPLVFFHMTASSSEAYEPLMHELDGRVPTIALDMMNYGESFRTTRKPEVSYISEILMEAISNLGVESFHTFDHHTGVSIQAEMAVSAPGRVLSLIMNGPTYGLP